MSLISRFNPTPGLKELWIELARPRPYRFTILAFSILVTFCALYWITKERWIGSPEEPEVTYISTFEPDRSIEQIRAENVIAQKEKEAEEARQAEIAERRKEIYRTIGRATGLDVDEMERQIAAEEAAEEARKAEALGLKPPQKAGAKAKENSAPQADQTGNGESPGGAPD